MLTNKYLAERGRRVCIVWAASAIVAMSGCQSTGYQSIYDGKSLAAWHVNPEKIGHGTGGKWQVVDGAICGTQDPPGNGGILLSDQTYGDFEITVDVKPDFGLDSGLFLRSNEKGQAYQVMIDYHGRGNVGGIYLEGIGGGGQRNYNFNGDPHKIDIVKAETGFPFPITPEQWTKLWKKDAWNTIRAKIAGNPPTVDVWINGTQIAHFVDTEKRLPDAGRIALQVHGGGDWQGKQTRFRAIRIKPIERDVTE